MAEKILVPGTQEESPQNARTYYVTKAPIPVRDPRQPDRVIEVCRLTITLENSLLTIVESYTTDDPNIIKYLDDHLGNGLSLDPTTKLERRAPIPTGKDKTDFLDLDKKGKK